MASNSITHFISSAKNLSDLIYLETYFGRHPLTPLSPEKCIINDLQRLFDTVLNTPVPNNDHTRGLLGIIKCVQHFSFYKDDEQWQTVHECFVNLINKCTGYLIIHLEEDNILFQEILQLILQIIIDSSKYHIAVKNKMLQCLSPLIFDIIINKKLPLSLQRLSIQSLTCMVTRTDQERRKKVMELVYPKLAKFFDQLYTCGDFDTQLCIVEAILRFIVPDKNRKIFFVHFKHKNPDVIRNFLNVRSKDFDIDCRMFLNYINKSQGENALVISIPCYTILLDEVVIKKPPEQELFWVDFNRGAPSVSFWCSKSSLLTPRESEVLDLTSSTDWQLLIIKSEVVTEVKVKSIRPRLMTPNEVQRNFKEVQFTIDGRLEIRPLEEIECTKSKCIRIVFPRTVETQELEHKILPTIFKMKKLDEIYSGNKRKVSHSSVCHFSDLVSTNLERQHICTTNSVTSVGENECTSIETHSPTQSQADRSAEMNNTCGMPLQENKVQEIQNQTDKSIMKEESKLITMGRKISNTKTKIEFQCCFSSDDEKENSLESSLTNQCSDISSNKPINKRDSARFEVADRRKYIAADKSPLSVSVNENNNNENIIRNQICNDSNDTREILKTKAEACSNSTTLALHNKMKRIKVSTTISTCNFTGMVKEQGQDVNTTYSSNGSFSSNNHLTIQQKSIEKNEIPEGFTYPSDKNLPKENRAEVSNEKVKENSKIYLDDVSEVEKHLNVPSHELQISKKKITIFRSIKKCIFNMMGNETDIDSIKQNVNNIVSNNELKETDASSTVSVPYTGNKNEKGKLMKSSSFVNKAVSNVKETLKKDGFKQSDSKNKNESEQNYKIHDSKFESTSTSFKVNDVDIASNKSEKSSEKSDQRRATKISKSLQKCLFRPAENNETSKYTMAEEQNYKMNNADEISDKSLSNMSLKDKCLDKNKNDEKKVAVHFDIKHHVLDREIKEKGESSISPTKASTLKISVSRKQPLQIITTSKRGKGGNKSTSNKRMSPQVRKKMSSEGKYKLQSYKEAVKNDSNILIRRSTRIQNSRRQPSNVCDKYTAKVDVENDVHRENVDHDRDEKIPGSDDDKYYFKKSHRKKHLENRNRRQSKEVSSISNVPDKSTKDNSLQITNTVASKSNSGEEEKSKEAGFSTELKSDYVHINNNLEHEIQEIQDKNVELVDKSHEVSENSLQIIENRNVEVHSSAGERKNCMEVEANNKLIVDETQTCSTLEINENQSKEEEVDFMNTSSKESMKETMHSKHSKSSKSHDEEQGDLESESTEGEDKGTKSCSLMNNKKMIKSNVDKAKMSESEKCSLNFKTAKVKKDKISDMIHNSSPLNDVNSENENLFLQQRENDTNLENATIKLRDKQEIPKEDFRERHTRDVHIPETVINNENEIESLSHNEIRKNLECGNDINQLGHPEDHVSEKAIAQLSPASSNDVSHIVTEAVVHAPPKYSSSKGDKHITKCGVDTVITRSVKVFKFFSQNITSVEKRMDNPSDNLNKNTSNSESITNTMIKDSVKKTYIQEMVTNELKSTDTSKLVKETTLMTGSNNSNSNKRNTIVTDSTARVISKDSESSLTNARKYKRTKTNCSRNRKTNYSAKTHSETKQSTSSRSLRKRKTVSYAVGSSDSEASISLHKEDRTNLECGNSGQNKMARGSVKKKLFTLNEADIVSLCSGSQNSYVAINFQPPKIKEVPVITDKCVNEVWKNKIHDEFDQLLETSPPPLPKRNPNHWQEKYRNEIQRSSSKPSLEIQKSVSTRKRKHSVYSDFDSGSDMSVSVDNKEHQRLLTDTVKKERKNSNISITKNKNKNFLANSESKKSYSGESSNDFNEKLLTNEEANIQKSPMIVLDEPSHLVTKNNNSNENCEISQKSADKEDIMDKNKQEIKENGKKYIGNSREKELMRRERKGSNKRPRKNIETGDNFNSRDQVMQDVIHLENNEEFLEINTDDHMKDIVQPEQSFNSNINHENDNYFVTEKHLVQNNDNDDGHNNEDYEIIQVSVQQNAETQQRMENINCDTSMTVKEFSDHKQTECYPVIKSPKQKKGKHDDRRTAVNVGKNKCNKHSRNKQVMGVELGSKSNLNKSRYYETPYIKAKTVNIDTRDASEINKFQRSQYKSLKETEVYCISDSDKEDEINDPQSVECNNSMMQTTSKGKENVEKKIRMIHKKFQRETTRHTEVSQLMFENGNCSNELQDCSKHNSGTLINNYERIQESESKIHREQNVRDIKVFAHGNKVNSRESDDIRDLKVMSVDNFEIPTINKTKFVHRNTVLCDKELSENQNIDLSRVCLEQYNVGQNCELETEIEMKNSDTTSPEDSFSDLRKSFVSSSQAKEIIELQSKGQMQSNKLVSKSRYEIHTSQKTQSYSLQTSPIPERGSEVDSSSLSSIEVMEEHSEEVSLPDAEMKKEISLAAALKNDIQRSVYGKVKYVKEFSGYVSKAIVDQFSHSSSMYMSKRAAARKYLDDNVNHNIHKVKEEIQKLDGFIEDIENKFEEMKEMVANQNCIDNEIKQSFTCIENAYEDFAANVSNEPKFDIQQLISTLDERYRKETLRNMIKKLHNICDFS